MLDTAIKPPENGIWKKIPLDRLIEKIFVAPGSPDYFRELVVKILLKYNLDKKVIQSSLDEDPVF
jgi:hypothetical protein